jgi:D-alanine transaminase
LTRVVYVNGAYRRYGDAMVHVEDRGFQFADSIYEVIEVNRGALVDLPRHLERMERSLRELSIAMPSSRRVIELVIARVVRQNRVTTGLAYIQITRGEAPRDFAFPPPDVASTLVVLARSQSRPLQLKNAERGIAVATAPDIRWQRSDIKTVMLLPACLAKQAAAANGAKEAWFVDAKGFVTEGASSNAWIVTPDGALVTRPTTDNRILAGVTRRTCLDAARAEGLRLEERAFSLEEARGAREAFITSATNLVMPVVSIDGRAIGDGRPGPVSTSLRARFHDFAEFSDNRRGQNA